MANAEGIRAGQAYVELATKDGKLTKGLRAAQQKLQAFGASVKAVGMASAAFDLARIIPLATAGKIFADLGSEMFDMSQRTGVSVEALSGLGYAAQQSGADMETLETGLRKMQKLVTEAANGSGEANKTLASLGLTIADLSKLKPEEQFQLIADRLSKIPNPTQRAAIALDAFGKSGTKLLPMMADGAKGIEQMIARANKLGLIMSTEDAQAADEFGDLLGDLWATLKMGVFIVGSALAPTLKGLAESFVTAVKAVSDWIKERKVLVTAIFAAAAASLGLSLAIIGIGYAISFAGAAIGAAMTIFSVAGAILGAIKLTFLAILTPVGLLVAAIVGLGGYLLYTSGAGGKALAWLGEQFQVLKEVAIEAWQGISDALAAGDIALAGKIVWAGLKVAWLQGIAWLKNIWSQFRDFFINVFWDAIGRVKGAFTDAWLLIQVAWADSVAAMLGAWHGFVASLKRGWAIVAGEMRKALAWKNPFTARENIAEINKEIDARIQEINVEQESTVNEVRQGAEQKKQAAAQEWDQKRQAADAAFRQQQLERELAGMEEMRKANADVAAAQKDWQDALDEAKKAREAKEAIDPKKQLAVPDLDELKGQVKQATTGTFSALAVRGLAGGNVQERMAKGIDRIDANIKKLLDEAKDGGLVFA